MHVDLGKCCEDLKARIGQSLIQFADSYPKTKISTVGLAGDGFHGKAALFLDTPEHSASHVNEWLQHGPLWYGEDATGRFCNNCPDFAYCIGEYQFVDYPDFYQLTEDDTIQFILPTGEIAKVEFEEGNEGMNRVIFPFLKTILAQFQPFAQLSKSKPFRIGVQMYDSEYEEFWLIDSE